MVFDKHKPTLPGYLTRWEIEMGARSIYLNAARPRYCKRPIKLNNQEEKRTSKTVPFLCMHMNGQDSDG